MKKLSLMILIMLLTGFVLFAEAESITIKNDTGYKINYIYFSPSDFDDWGDDFLNGQSLEDGEEINIMLDRDIDVDQIIYDLQAIDEDDDYYTIYETDISDTPEVNITMEAYDGGDYDDYDDYDYSDYEERYNEGYSEGYKQGYIDAFRDAYLEGFKEAQNLDLQSGVSGNSNSGSNWR